MNAWESRKQRFHQPGKGRMPALHNLQHGRWRLAETAAQRKQVKHIVVGAINGCNECLRKSKGKSRDENTDQSFAFVHEAGNE